MNPLLFVNWGRIVLVAGVVLLVTIGLAACLLVWMFNSRHRDD